MNYEIMQQVRTLSVLVRRDIFLFYRGIWDDLVNAFVHVTAVYFALGVLAPYLGLVVTLGCDSLIGSIASMFLSRAFSAAIADSFDMKDVRFIDYKRTLPLSTWFLLMSYVVSYVIALTLCTFPLFFLSKLYLGSLMPLSHIQWLAFITVYLLSMICISMFFICCIFSVSFEWLRFNMWQRILIPLNTFGCFMFSWKRLFAFSPLWGRILLLNPFTYIAEGLRAALFGNEMYISVYYCIPVLLLWIGVLLCVMRFYICKRVEEGV